MSYQWNVLHGEPLDALLTLLVLMVNMVFLAVAAVPIACAAVQYRLQCYLVSLGTDNDSQSYQFWSNAMHFLFGCNWVWLLRFTLGFNKLLMRMICD